jgi:dTDP-4-dehydrorhamnose 3,5-epimerase-like enzyme
MWMDVPRVSDPRGNLSFVEGERHIPFAIRRIYYIYGLPRTAARGGHAHRALEQVILCLSGSMVVDVDEGYGIRYTVRLNRPDRGLYIPPMIWTTQTHFSPHTLYMVIASQIYDEADYIRNYDEFTHLLASSSPPRGGN